jgi:hypothetical protein
MVADTYALYNLQKYICFEAMMTDTSEGPVTVTSESESESEGYGASPLSGNSLQDVCALRALVKISCYSLLKE